MIENQHIQGGACRFEKLIHDLRNDTEKWIVRVQQANPDEAALTSVCELLSECVRKLSSPPSGHRPIARQIRGFLISHLHQGPTLKDLSELLGYSEKYCSKMFLAKMGEPFSLYLKCLRVDRAKALLQQEQRTLQEIAQALGFSDQFVFSHFFKKAVGCAPQYFRRQVLSLP